MSVDRVLRDGDPIEWVGPDYVEGAGAVRVGMHGMFITTDGDFDSNGLVVSFDPVGAFCCRRQDIRRLTGE